MVRRRRTGALPKPASLLALRSPATRTGFFFRARPLRRFRCQIADVATGRSGSDAGGTVTRAVVGPTAVSAPSQTNRLKKQAIGGPTGPCANVPRLTILARSSVRLSIRTMSYKLIEQWWLTLTSGSEGSGGSSEMS
jgi:hypothetical protein